MKKLTKVLRTYKNVQLYVSGGENGSICVNSSSSCGSGSGGTSTISNAVIYNGKCYN